RRFLPLNHEWRNDKKSFDGTVELRLPPNTSSGDDILDQVADLDGLPVTNDKKKKVKVSHDSRAKCLKPELEKIEAQIPETLCKSEKVFIPAFFDVMEYLQIHLANEAMIGRPVQYRSMYSVERWLYFLKLFIRNRSCVERSIVERYIANEFTTLCSRYLHTMETKFNLLERNYAGGAIESDGGLMIFCQPEQALKGGKPHRLDLKEMEHAHIYILKNCDEVQPFLEEFSQYSGDSSQKQFDRQFINWFKEKIEGLYKHDDSKKMADLLTLSRGPMKNATRFKGNIINEYRFHVQDYDKGLRTQNCGIVVVGETDEEDGIIYYCGELTEILELQFQGGRQLVLFRCMWFDVYDNERGVKMDEYDFLSVNPQRFLKIDEPFVLANQVSQVFYARDHSNKGWNVV
ncbi:hypothetical protein MTR67_051786, partial [Solanum verrucosum]